MRSRGFIAARRVMPVALHAANEAVHRGTETFHALDHALHGRLQQHKPVGKLVDNSFQAIEFIRKLLNFIGKLLNFLLQAVEINFHAMQEVTLDHLVVAQASD